MITQPTTLKPADALESCSLHVGDPEQAQAAAELRRLSAIEDEWARLSQDEGKAAAKLRRLHAVNQELLEALRPFAVYGRWGSRDVEVGAALAAIAKAEEQI
jgi:hypothetical protein